MSLDDQATWRMYPWSFQKGSKEEIFAKYVCN